MMETALRNTLIYFTSVFCIGKKNMKEDFMKLTYCKSLAILHATLRTVIVVKKTERLIKLDISPNHSCRILFPLLMFLGL